MIRLIRVSKVILQMASIPFYSAHSITARPINYTGRLDGTKRIILQNLTNVLVSKSNVGI